MNPTIRKNAFLASSTSISAVRYRLFIPTLCTRQLGTQPVRGDSSWTAARTPGGEEPARQCRQGRVEVEGQVGVGPGRPAIVGGPAGRQRGPADGQRVQRIS